MVLIDGLHVPLTVPFTRDGRLALHKLEANVRRYSLSPAAGLVALAPRAEAASLSDAETRDFLDTVSAAAGPEKVLVAAITRSSVVQALTVAALALRARFDAVLLAAPPCWPEMLRHDGSAAGILNFFRTVADNSPLPVLLSSDMATPRLGLSAETVAALATHPNIIGLYDQDLTSARLGDLVRRTRDKQQDATVTATFRPVTARMAGTGETEGFISAAALLRKDAPTSPAAPALKTRTKRIGFQIITCGPASTALDLLQNGASGFMPALAAPAPQACHEVLAALQDGDPALASARGARLSAADSVLDALGAPAAAYACDRNGYFGGTPRLPLVPLTAINRARVDAAMQDLPN
jgi:dihydrodipicolinate synthase/N-acetylneuraminate lyase